MNKRLFKISLLSLVAAAIAGMTSVRADDTNSATADAKPAQANRFMGTISAVDTNAMTFTVGEQTFNVTSESQLSRNGQPATIADLVVGDPARGGYTTDANGKLDATKARFGKKMGGKKKKSSEGGDSSSTNAAPTSVQN